MSTEPNHYSYRPTPEERQKGIKKFNARVGERLRYFRELRGTTRQALADFLLITSEELRDYEEGKVDMTISSLLYCCEALEMQLTDLYYYPRYGLYGDNFDYLLYKLFRNFTREQKIELLLIAGDMTTEGNKIST